MRSSDLTPQTPLLRSDLLRDNSPDDEGNTVLRDPLTFHIHRLNPIAAALADRLDGQTPLADIKNAVEVQHALSLTEIEISNFIEDLRKRLLLDEPPIRARLHAAHLTQQAENLARTGLHELHFGRLLEHPEDAIQIRDDLRYGCRGCGACCSGRFRVELTPEDEQRLLALDLSRLNLSPADVIHEAYIPTQNLHRPRKFLRHHDGHCVFLGPDNLCEIHRQYGYQHKPLGCRIFPFAPLMTPRGPLIQFRPECSTQHRSRQTGPLIAPKRLAIWQEMAAGHKGISRIPDAFPVLGNLSIHYDTYHDWETTWRSTSRNLGWRQTLSHISQTLYHPSPPPNRRALSAAFSAIIDRTLQDSQSDRTPNFFETIIPGDITGDPLALPSLLLSLGALRPDDSHHLPLLLPKAQNIYKNLPKLNTPTFDALLSDYVTNFLFSKFAFSGLSLSSGLAFLWLSLSGTRRIVAYLHSEHGIPIDEDIINESLLTFHLLFFSRDIIRVHLLTRCFAGMEYIPSTPSVWL